MSNPISDTYGPMPGQPNGTLDSAAAVQPKPYSPNMIPPIVEEYWDQSKAIAAQVQEAHARLSALEADMRQALAQKREELAKLEADYAKNFGKPKAKRRFRQAKVAANGHMKLTPAQKGLDKLGNAFTLDDARKMFKGATGVSLAQLIRSKRIKKTADGYQRV